MKTTTRTLTSCKRIALVAHDHKKQDLINWVKNNRTLLEQHELLGTGTTGNLIEKEGAVNVEVLVKTEGGVELSAIITGTSAKNLNLTVGSEVTTLVKASQVVLAVKPSQ